MQRSRGSTDTESPRPHRAEEGGQYKDLLPPTLGWRPGECGTESIVRKCNIACLGFILSHRHPLLDAVGDRILALSQHGHSYVHLVIGSCLQLLTSFRKA